MSKTAHSSLLFGQAWQLFESGRSEEAKALCRRMESAEPRFPGAHYLLGLIALSAGDAKEAARRFKRAAALSPGQSAPLFQLARALGQAGKPAQALEQIYSALKFSPGEAQGWFERAAILRSLNRHREEAEALARAAGLKPDWPEALAALGGVLRELGETEAALPHLERAVALRPDHLPSLLALAQARLAMGMAESAMDDLARLRSEDSQNPAVRILSGEAAEKLGRQDDAIAHYRQALALDPEDRGGASLALARLGAAEAPAKAPQAHVRDLFDRYAPRFDEALVERLGYSAPELLAQAARQRLGGKASGLHALDLGCGTGLAGVALRPLASRLDGIDLSPVMLSQARARGLYDRLEEGDIQDALGKEGAYDLIAAADVLVYLGNLEEVCAGAWRSLKPDGLFLFTLERLEDGRGDFALMPSQRYAHSVSYVERLAREMGFAIDRLEEASTRDDGGKPVPGLLAVLTKPA
jgi:predicted TPR repeat methyltransferase